MKTIIRSFLLIMGILPIINAANITTTEATNSILVGSYGKPVQTLALTVQYSEIINTSWMSRISTGILMNNEFASILYLGQNDSTEILKQYSLNSIKSPVYFSHEIDGKIYIACYGDGQGEKAGIAVTDLNLNNVQEFIIATPPPNHIHCVDVFTPTETTAHDPFLIAINLGDDKLYRIDPKDDTVLFDDVLYTFPAKEGLVTNPRHFVQLPGTNRIVVITEEFNDELVLLEYANDKFKFVSSYDLKQLAPYSTGAELKLSENGKLYTTIRQYVSEFKVPYPDPANGLLAEFEISGDSIHFNRKLTVGENPRYFVINGTMAYVANQQSSSVMEVNLTTMQVEKTYSLETGTDVAYILLPNKINKRSSL